MRYYYPDRGSMYQAANLKNDMQPRVVSDEEGRKVGIGAPMDPMSRHRFAYQQPRRKRHPRPRKVK